MGFDAEYSYVPSSIQTKPDFYAHVLANLKSLLQETSVDGQQLKTNWVSALSSVASVLYNSYADFAGFGSTNRVNWAGFYVVQSLFPGASTLSHQDPSELLVGPYHGRPGCLRIPLKLKRKGVCADAFLRQETVAVNDVHLVPGHIACDGTTASEIVIPIILPASQGVDKGLAIGVLDIDCQSANVWTQEDIDGLQSIVDWLSGPSSPVEWGIKR